MLTLAEANLSALIESTEDLVWSVDLNWVLVTFNRAFEQNIESRRGLRPMAGMGPVDLLPPERAAMWPPLYERALAEGPFRAEVAAIDDRTLEMALSPIVMDGKAVGVSALGKDITERKRAERALLEAERKYQETFDEAHEGMFQAAPDGTALTGNRAMARMLGYDSVEEAKTRIKDTTQDVWVDPEERTRFMRQLLEQGVVRGFECLFKRKDGGSFWASVSCRKTYRGDGRTAANEGFVEDISERKRAEAQIRESEERYRRTFEQAPVGIIHTSFEGRFLRCNARFAEIVGYSQEEILGMTFQQITVPEDIGKSLNVLELALNGVAEAGVWEKRYVRKDGSPIWVRLTQSTLRDGEGRILHFITLVEDINARKTAEARLATALEGLRTSEARYRTIFETSVDFVSINRFSDGAYLDVNRSFLDTTGYTREEVVGRPSSELGIWADPQDRKNLIDLLEFQGQCRNLEVRFRRKNGEVFSALMSAAAIEIDGVPCIVSMTRDISDAKAAEDKIRDLAFYDPLTRLPNRRLLLDRLKQALASSTRSHHRHALLFVDLDNFKKQNDAVGRQNGDLLLQEVARRLTACVREVDTVARQGGDEFVVILEELSEVAQEAASQAKSLAERILVATSRPYLVGGRECHNGVSIGIAVFEDHPESAIEVLQQAETAMFQAKAAGRNTIRFFEPALQEAVNARAAMEDDLRQAIQSNQFVLYYQPQVSDGVLIGAETLIRWNHPKRGLVAPGEFIPLAEETGLILPLGNWVLETACRQIAWWAERKEADGIKFAVNISARQLRQPGFVERVLEVLESTGANPQNLVLELTESMLVENTEDVIAKMTDLKAHGLRFALDDFGTGYSSLSYLKRLPLDELKIDRTFVRDILGNAASGAIARAIISLSQAMRLSVIAEGVETVEQEDLLAGLGCHSFQGFLFSRPLPVEEFERSWLGLNRDAACLPA
jgi:diguanylate cyclase (GGDEF)-like protein/PAS domain S-box-containing protein